MVDKAVPTLVDLAEITNLGDHKKLGDSIVSVLQECDSVGSRSRELIEETVKSCVSPLIKEMMNGATGMMMAAVGVYPGGGGHGMGVLSPMLMPNLGDERWRRQQILELEVYSRRLELVQEQIRATLHELKTMPSGR